MTEKYHQPGFFLTADSCALQTHTAEGSKMIKPKVKKEYKPRSKTLTPFKEYHQFLRIKRQRTKILEEYSASEDMNGNISIMRNGQKSQIGSDEAIEFLKILKVKQPELPEIPILSTGALKYKYIYEKQQQERGPLRATQLPDAGPFDALGNLLKK